MTFRTRVHVACPRQFTNVPSESVWKKLVRSADSVSNNLTEADDAVTAAGFLHKVKLTLHETKESRTCLEKIRLAKLDRFEAVMALEREAGELCAIFATIAMRVSDRPDREKPARKQPEH